MTCGGFECGPGGLTPTAHSPARMSPGLRPTYGHDFATANCESAVRAAIALAAHVSLLS